MTKERGELISELQKEIGSRSVLREERTKEEWANYKVVTNLLIDCREELYKSDQDYENGTFFKLGNAKLNT